MASNIPNLQFGQQTTTGQNNAQFGQGVQGYNSSIQMNNMFQPQSIFMQPIGNIYGLNNSSEVSNMPIGTGVSVGLCLSEGTMYLKSMQSNGPVLLGYRLCPLESQQNISNRSTSQQQSAPQSSGSQENTLELFRKYEERIQGLEKQIASIQSQPKPGGKQEWPL